MVVSSTSMKLASATTMAISHGLAPLPLAAVGAPAWIDATLIATPAAVHRAGAWIDSHGRDHRHARPERDVGRRIVHNDLDRHALHDLDVVAGGVLGRQQRERGAGSRLNAVDVTADGALRIGVDVERHRLSRPHAVELNLLEVGCDPDLIRDEYAQVGARLCELADGGAEVGD